MYMVFTTQKCGLNLLGFKEPLFKQQKSFQEHEVQIFEKNNLPLFLGCLTIDSKEKNQPRIFTTIYKSTYKISADQKLFRCHETQNKYNEKTFRNFDS